MKYGNTLGITPDDFKITEEIKELQISKNNKKEEYLKRVKRTSKKVILGITKPAFRKKCIWC